MCVPTLAYFGLTGNGLFLISSVLLPDFANFSALH